MAQKFAELNEAQDEILKEYVRGDSSLNKRLNSKVFGRSIEFRHGLLTGII